LFPSYSTLYGHLHEGEEHKTISDMNVCDVACGEGCDRCAIQLIEDQYTALCVDCKIEYGLSEGNCYRKHSFSYNSHHRYKYSSASATVFYTCSLSVYIRACCNYIINSQYEYDTHGR